MGKLFRVGDSITTDLKIRLYGQVFIKRLRYLAVRSDTADPEYFNRLRNECAACGVFTKEFLDKAKKDREKWKLDRQKVRRTKQR